MFSSNTTQVSSGGYEIQRSLRFNSADSANLSRTPASASNQQKFSWSGWIKRSRTTSGGEIICSASNGNLNQDCYICFGGSNVSGTTADAISFFSPPAGNNISISSTAVYRDLSAWYHIVISVDTTQATAANRVKIYVNGSEVTYSSTTYPSQNQNLNFNSANLFLLGTRSGNFDFYSGYMTEVNFIDGQALTPSSFGEINADTGVWQPKRYAGSYGTNGFYLNFSDNSNTTAATLGADYSGNGNNWTPNNFSVTAGTGNDSLVDVPTNWGVDTGVGGTVRGNYATLNPLQISTTFATISNGNLQYVDTTAGGSYRSAYSTVFASSGKYYFEATLTVITGDSNNAFIGVSSPPPQNDTYIEQTITGYQGYGYQGNGNKATNDTYTVFGSTYAAGDVISAAVDIDTGKVWFAKNGTWQASGNPSAGTNQAFDIVAGRSYGFAVSNGSSASSIQWDCNFGQRPFAYTAPSGFKALNTQNLPTPTIGATPATQAGKFFNPVLYTGNGFTNRTITTGLQSDFVWIKNRSSTGPTHILFDVIRGAGQTLYTSSTSAEVNNGTAYVQQFNSDNFLLGVSDSASNGNGSEYVSWVWRANGAGVTNTAGSITSTVSANTTSGFSVVTCTTQSSGTGTVGHGLGVAPAMIITKARGISGSWTTYHASLGNTQAIYLNLTDAAATVSTVWNNTSPTSSVFTFGAGFAGSISVVAYCFAEVPGYSRFGSYTGNGSTDGVFVFTGMRPAYVMIKSSSITNDWVVFDDARNTSNAATQGLYPNLSIAEQSFSGIDILSNGFKLRNSAQLTNQSGTSYIFAAFAESPQKFSLAR
jgi:hypothetical protein